MSRYEFGVVDTLKSVAPWTGGKYRSYKIIVERIMQTPHRQYAEPFVGMGGIFLRRPVVVKYEFINDYNKDVSNLFRVLQRHYDVFTDAVQFLVSSRDEFERQVNTNPDVLTDVERAVRFYYIQRICYGGQSISPCFGVDRKRTGRFNIKKLESDLKALHNRLSGVVIECLSYESFIPRYDDTDTLFYLDPPYYGSENGYGPGLFNRDDYVKICILLHNLEGRFLMSLNDTPEIRGIFSTFNIETIDSLYTMQNRGKNIISRELLISG